MTGWLAFAVYHPGDGKIIGEVGIFVEKEPISEGNAGWMLPPDYHGPGYAAEAALIFLVRYAFLERHLHRLMKRLGMRREGHFRQSRPCRGEWQDDHLKAPLRDEWLIPQAQMPPAGLSPE